MTLHSNTADFEKADPGAAQDSSTGGDAHAAKVAALFREHNRVLVSFLRARLQSEQDAREIAQEAYVKLLQLDRPGAVSFLRSYLFRTAANLAVDRLRRRETRRRAELLEVFEPVDMFSAPPESRLAAAQDLSFIKSCLQELPSVWREAFIRNRALGESEVSIAKSLGLSDRMIRNYLAQTLSYCHARIEGETPEQARDSLRK